MLKFFINLIGIAFFLCPFWAEGWDCPAGGELIVTAPRSGAHTFNDTIAVRGFLCGQYPVVLVQNRTTQKAVLTDTDESCSSKRCVYTFATFISDLALGENDLQATVPGKDPPLEVRVQVIRTALAQK